MLNSIHLDAVISWGNYRGRTVRDLLGQDPDFLNPFILANQNCYVSEVDLAKIAAFQPEFQLSEEARRELEVRKKAWEKQVSDAGKPEEDESWIYDYEKDYHYGQGDDGPSDDEWDEENGQEDDWEEWEGDDDDWENDDSGTGHRQYGGSYYMDEPNYERDTYNAMTDGQYDNYDDWRSRGGNLDDLFDDLGR